MENPATFIARCLAGAGGRNVETDSSEAGAPRGPKLRKREAERLKKRQQMKIWVAVIAFAAGASVVAGAVFLLPPAAPPVDIGPGVVVSQNPMHIHPKLTILTNGVQRTIPSSIGLQGGIWASHDLDHFLDLREGAAGSLSPVHTHDSSGVIHVEAAVTRGFTLGEFFDVWGQPLGPDRTVDLVADQNHVLTLTVDGQPSSAWRNVVFHDGQNIVISYSTA